jgi:hypothetical protein
MNHDPVGLKPSYSREKPHVPTQHDLDLKGAFPGHSHEIEMRSECSVQTKNFPPNFHRSALALPNARNKVESSLLDESVRPAGQLPVRNAVPSM